MRHWTLALLGVAMVVPSGTAGAAATGEGGMKVLGRVISASSPVPEALVIALSLTDSISFRSGTNSDGAYQLPELPRGIYRVLAVKRGFAPAMATIVPNRPNHSINFNLRTEASLSASEREEIWKIRRSIPSDILRELEMEAAPVEAGVADRDSTLSGVLHSLSGIGSEQGGNWTQTAVGIRGSVDGWAVGLNGRLASSEERVTGEGPVSPGFENSTVAMRIESTGDSVYEIRTNRARWFEPTAMDAEVSVNAHSLGWRGEQSEVEIRYLDHQNVLSNDSRAQIALEGGTRLIDRKSFDVGVAFKIEQFEGSGALRYEVAELATTAEQKIGEAVSVAYGLRGRYSDIGTQWVPETSARIELGRQSSIVVSGHYKVYQDDQEILTLPAILYFDDKTSTYPRYRYAFGMIFGSEEDFISAIASVAEIDARTRMLFNQRFDGRADGLWLNDGDVTRDLTVTMRRLLAGRLALEVASTAGEASSVSNEPSKYLTGSVQSLYRPWGTSLDLAYRYIEHGALSDAGLLENERLAFRMGQSLWLPLDLKVLLGIDFIRDGLTDSDISNDADIVQTRLVGGLSLAF